MHPVLEGIAANQRIASAYLFAGPPGAPKAEAAREFAEKIGACRENFIVFRPTETTFKIEQVRAVQRAVRYGPNASRYLVVLIEEADKMTPEAAAAFLKTLEEPPPGVVFILGVEREDQLPQTIHSRCQKIIFGEPLVEWRGEERWAEFRQELAAILGQGDLAALQFSARLEKEREELKAILYDLAFYARRELANWPAARILLEAVKELEKRGSVKLTLDVACLSLGGVLE